MKITFTVLTMLLLAVASIPDMDALVEMARWHFAAHASFARRLLGRIAGIEESKLDTLVMQSDQAEAIITAAQKSH